MLKLLLTTALVGLIATPAFAQSTKDKLLALEEALNDPSPIIRLAAVEEALVDSSAAVRRYAQSQALASDDDDIKAMAITSFFQTRKQLTVLVGKSAKLLAKEASLNGDEQALQKLKQSEYSSYRQVNAYNPSIIYLIKSFNPTSGEVKGYCMKNQTAINERYRFTGSIVGDQISLEHKCQVSPQSCTIQMQLASDAKFLGSMRCGSKVDYPAYIELPLK